MVELQGGLEVTDPTQNDLTQVQIKIPTFQMFASNKPWESDSWVIIISIIYGLPG